MKKIILIIIYVFSFPIFAQSNPLIGEWLSDREKTIHYLTKHAKLTEAQSQTLDILLGRMKLTFSTNKVVINYDSSASEFTYQIIEKSKEYIKVRIENDSSELFFYFDANYIYQKYTSSFFTREYFSKVK